MLTTMGDVNPPKKKLTIMRYANPKFQRNKALDIIINHYDP